MIKNLFSLLELGLSLSFCCCSLQKSEVSIMGTMVTTEVIYAGVKTGTKKNSSDGWCMYQFKAPENYKGVYCLA
jgi:hypothetical protein